ncbi:MAG: protein kinase [Verrucomicrobiales bacterium]|nr:protein kinase [Verrucomicrobiales bacterium]
MKACDTCGASIPDEQALPVCPKCLFADALEAPPADSTAEITGNTGGTFPGAFAQMAARRDFFEKYDLRERIGSGGQGEVYRAWDFDLRRYVAMKRLADTHLRCEAAVYRFVAEAQIASQIEHPGILPVYDVGVDPDGKPFYTTAILPGRTLGDVFKSLQEPRDVSSSAAPERTGPSLGGEWTLPRALELVLRLCETMAYAHSRGVIHRDLKPSNVLVGKFGDIQIIDWGSAHVLQEARVMFAESFVALDQARIETARSEAIEGVAESPLATATTGQPITLLFTPPEILDGQLDQLGPPTDIYSVGVMLYELCTGRLPYADREGKLPHRAKLEALIREAQPEPVQGLNRSISRDLASICEKAMARDPAARYVSMQELADDIRAFLEVRPVKARRASYVVKLQKWAQRNSAPVIAACVVLSILTLGGALAWRLKSQKDHARQITALRDTELAARSGRWRKAIEHLRTAEDAGYKDTVHLGLQRVDAWEALNQHDKVQAELDNLMRRPDRDRYRGAVLLKLGTFELFAPDTQQKGVEHVSQAMALGLDRADEAFAKGLLAESTPDALEHFREVLQWNPHHRLAHFQIAGLCFLLGRHRDLENSLETLKILSPEDPAPLAMQAVVLALNGELEKAEEFKRTIKTIPQEWKLLLSNLSLLAMISEAMDIRVALGEKQLDPSRIKRLKTELAFLGLGGFSPSSIKPGVRIVQLPCFKNGLEQVSRESRC